MKKTIAIFLACFVLLGTTGYRHGRRGSVTEEAYAFSRATIETDGTGTFFIAYKVEGNAIYRFNTDTDALASYTDLHDRSLSKPYKEVLKEFSETVLIRSLIWGGASITLKPKDLLDDKERNLLAATLGAVSGYSFGYKVAMRSSPEPDSPVLLALLSDDKLWRSYEDEIYASRWKQIYSRSRLLKDEEKRKSITYTLRVQAQEALKGQDGVKSSDFEGLAGTAAALSNSRSEFISLRGIFSQPVPFWQEPWFLLLASLFAAALITLIMLWWERRRETMDS